MMFGHSSARLRWGADINVVFDGNSLLYGNGASGGQTLPVQISNLPPMSRGASMSNVAIAGQSIASMMSPNAADVDGAFVDGKKNVLVLWEGTNSVTQGRTGLQAASDMAAYIAERKAAHSWDKVVVLTSIPLGYWLLSSQITWNDELNAYNAYLKANYKSIGIDSLVDTRKEGSPFVISDYSTVSAVDAWQAASGLWYDRVHLNNAGYAVVAGYVADALKRLRAR